MGLMQRRRMSEMGGARGERSSEAGDSNLNLGLEEGIFDSELSPLVEAVGDRSDVGAAVVGA